MKIFILFIVFMLLFILLLPGIIIQPPKIYKYFFIFGHSLIFTVLYVYLRKQILNTNVVEGMQEDKNNFSEEEMSKFKDIHDQFNEYIDSIPEDVLVKFSIDEMNTKIKEIIPNISDEDLIRYKQYEVYITGKPEFDKHFEKSGKFQKSDIFNKITDTFEKKVNVALNECPPEKINFILDLKRDEINALEAIVSSLNIEQTEKLVHLDNDKIKEMIQKVVNEYK